MSSINAVRVTIVVAIAAAALAVAAPRHASNAGTFEPTVQLRLRPTVGQAPMSVRAVVEIRRDRDNRWLVLTLESTQFFRSSRIQLDGAEAARRYERLYEHLGPGVYDVRAELFGSRGARGVAVGSLKVAGD